MSTVLTPPPKTKVEPKITSGGQGLGDGLRGGGNGGGHWRPERHDTSGNYRLGIWIGLISVLMLFLALTSAYIVNQAHFFPLIVPPVLWLNTAVILTSSLTFEVARRSLRHGSEAALNSWLMVTAVLGLGFLVGQLVAWQQLVASGFYLSTNRHSAYAYTFTGLHALHLAGGLLALLYVLVRTRRGWAAPRKRVSIDATAIYWHFMDGLWIYLFILLFFWR